MKERLTIGPIDVIDQFERFGALDDVPQWVWTECWRFEITSDEMNAITFIYLADDVPSELIEVMLLDGFEHDRDDDIDWSAITRLVEPTFGVATAFEAIGKFAAYVGEAKTFVEV